MVRNLPIISSVLSLRYLWIGILLGATYWFLESAIHVFIFREGLFFGQFFTIDPHEVWKRLLVAGLLIVFSLYAQHGINIRRRTEAALKTSEKKYRTLFQEALNPIFMFDRNGELIDHNRASLDFFECCRNDLLARNFWELVDPEHGKMPAENSFLLNKRRNIEMDYPVQGKLKTMLLNIVPLASLEMPVVYGIGQDITRRKQMEKNIKLAHAELNHIFQTASVGMRLIDSNFNVLKINETFAELSGADADTAAGRKCYEVFAGEMCHTAGCPLKIIMGGEKEVEYELEKERIDGRKMPCLLTARPFIGTEGELIGIVESFKDITDLKRAQEELRTERDKLSSILFHQFEGVGIVGLDYSIEYQNTTLKEQVGDCEGKNCYQAFRGRDSHCQFCYMYEAIRTGKLTRCEFDSLNGRSYEHTYTPFKETDGENKVVVLLRDITERKASRAAAIRSEQLAAIGELAAGVAHEINNPINGIINYGQMLINQFDRQEKVKDIAGRVVKEGDRIAKIVESLLSYARREKYLRITSTINEILNDTLTLIGAQMRKETINLKVDIAAQLPPIVCVPQEIQQVFLNILSNARYALNNRDPDIQREKVLEIEAGLLNTGGSQFLRTAFFDNGTGIPKYLVDKVMNPFFSTKPAGIGTGLGLSISHGIINDHGGKLTVESVEGKFTWICVDLPTGNTE